MRPHAALVALVLVACGEQRASSPPPEAATPQQATAPSPEQQYAAAVKEAEERSRREYAAAQAQQEQAEANVRASIAKGQADLQAQKDAREAEAKKSCEASREKRVANARSAMKQRIDFESKVKARSKEVVAACKLVDRPTGAVNVQRSGSGLRVAPEMRDDVVCSKGVPAGFTKEEVWVVLARIRSEGKATIEPSDSIMASEDHDGDDAACRSFDAAAGLDLYVTYADAEGLRRVLTWKPSTAAP